MLDGLLQTLVYGQFYRRNGTAYCIVGKPAEATVLAVDACAQFPAPVCIDLAPTALERAEGNEWAAGQPEIATSEQAKKNFLDAAASYRRSHEREQQRQQPQEDTHEQP